MSIKFSEMPLLPSVTNDVIVPIVDTSVLPYNSKTTTVGDLKDFVLDGNSATTSQLQTAVKINGTDFDGSIDINIDTTEKVYYVSPEGSDLNNGSSWGNSFASINYACTQITGPATIRVASGTYSEILPITIPSQVAIIGDSIRTSIVQPASGYETETMWLMGDGAILNKLHFVGLTGFTPSIADDTDIENSTVGGIYVAFDPATPVLIKSPYVIECTAKSAGSIGALVDGSVHATGIKSMVFHGYTVISDLGIGYWVKDAGKAEIVSCFTYYCHIGYAASGGGKIRALNGNNSYGVYGALSIGYDVDEITIDGTVYGNSLVYTPTTLTGTFVTGDTITGATSGATGIVTNFQPTADKIYYKLTSITPFQNGEVVSNGSVSATLTLSGVQGQNEFILVLSGLTEEPRPGSSIEFTSRDTTSYVIQSVTEYNPVTTRAIIVLAGEKSVENFDGDGFKIRYEFSNIRLTGHDFLNIGTGGITTTNYPGDPLQLPSQGNEVIELFPARVFYVSTDQDGNFRVGEYFRIDQATGRATLNASAFDLSGLTSLRLGSIGAQVGEQINEFSSDTTLSGNSNIAVPTEAAVKGYFTKITSNVNPGTDSTYNLGSTSFRWNDLNIGGKITGPATLVIDPANIGDDTGSVDIKGSLTVRGTSGLNSSGTTFNLINSTATTVNFAGTATTVNIGATTGSSTFKHDINIASGKKIKINGSYGSDNKFLKTVSGGLEWADAALTISDDSTTNSAFYPIFTSSTSGTITQASVSSTSFSINPNTGKLTLTGDFAVNSSTLSTNQTTFNLVNTNATTVNFAGAASTINIGAASGTTTVNNDLNLASGKTFKINSVDTLSSTTLGSNVVNSSLTSVGTLTSLTTSGTLAVNSSTGITTSQSSFNLINTNATTINVAGAATSITMAATSGTTNIRNSLTVGGDVIIDGSITISGSTSLLNATNVTISDNMLYLNEAVVANVSNAVGNGTHVTYTIDKTYNAGMVVTVTGMTPSSFNISGATITSATDTTFTVASTVTDTFSVGGLSRAKSATHPDLGFAGGYNDGTYHHAGLFRDASDGVWKFFQGYVPEPDASVYVDTTHASFAYAPLQAAAFTATSGTFSGTIAANNGSITTDQTTFNLIDTSATTVNFAGAATTLDIGASTGTTTINNALTVGGNLSITGSVGAITTTGTLAVNAATGITTDQTTFSLINANATTVNFAGAATTLDIGASTGTTTINNALTVDGAITFNNSSVSIPNSLNFDTNTLVIDSTNNRVGIGTNSPSTSLHISATDSIIIPAGTTLQRPTGVEGMLRYNSDLTSFEGYTVTGWGSIGGSVTTSDTPPSNPIAGRLWWNTSLGKLFVYYDDGTSSQWVEASPNQAGFLSRPVRQQFTATASQTTFTITGGYTAGMVDVFLDGVKLVNSDDVDVSSGTDIVLTVGASEDSIIDVVGLNSTTLANVVPLSGGNLNGDLTSTANISTTSLLSSNNITYTGTLTGSTGIVNIGSGQIYKDASGNVGIGTSSPSQQLEVHTTAKFGLGNSIGTSAIQFTHSNASALIWQLNSGISGVSHSSMSIGSSVTPTMLNIDSSGNIGIGTSSPSYKLDVSTNQTRVTNGTRSLFTYIDSGGSGIWDTVNEAGQGVYLNTANSFLALYTGSTEKMRLDSSGNLGLGVTPSAWNSTWKALQIGSVSSASSNSANALWSANEYINTGGSPAYITSQYALRYRQDVGSGIHSWLIAASGTAGNAISFTQAMTLDASGRLTIPYQPSFKVQLNADQSYSSGIRKHVAFTNVHWNTGNCYSTSTGRFTAPVAGYYFFEGSHSAGSGAAASSYLSFEFYVNGTRYVTGWSAKASGYQKEAASSTFYLNANDYVEIGFESAVSISFTGSASTAYPYSYWSGRLIC